MVESLADRLKARFASRGITIWVIYGIYALIVARHIRGILPFVIYFLPGIFVASFASIPPYLLDQAVRWRIVPFISRAFRPVGCLVALSFTILKLLVFAIHCFCVCVVARYFLRLIN
ncbi:MAG: hypothetical protein ONB30_06495 [candidate division KSB1 bacterium]|nr:hypothetical protein [candidate division KSB1 bacterium]